MASFDGENTNPGLTLSQSPFVTVYTAEGINPALTVPAGISNANWLAEAVPFSYADGYAAGYAAGYTAGYAAGLIAGTAAGYADGYADGDAAGQITGYALGYADGLAASYGVGYADGFAAASPATLSSPSPASGTDIASTRRVARYTPISFLVTNYVSFWCVWVKFRNEDRAFVAYDSATGFQAPFNNVQSTFIPVVPGTSATLTLLQSSGWQDDIEYLGVGGDVEPTICPVYAGGPGSIAPPRQATAPTGDGFSWTLPLE